MHQDWGSDLQRNEAFARSNSCSPWPVVGLAHGLQRANTAPSGQSIPSGQVHICDRFCTFEASFGNVFRCISTGTLHICDQNCNSRVPIDPYTAVCRLSKRTFPLQPADVSRMKRGSDTGDEFQAKRQQLHESARLGCAI